MKGTARKRGTDRWQIQVYAGVDPNTGRGRRVTRTIVAPHTKAGQKVVDQALAALILDVEHGRIGAGDDPTVAELLERWVRAREPEWSPKTTLENRRQIRLKIVPNIGSRRISKLRAADLDALYAQLHKKGGEDGGPLSPASVRRIHVIMHAALGQAVKWGLIAVNPADAAAAPSLPPSRITPPEPDARAKAMRLVDEGDIDYAAYLRLAATTGARRSQLVALHWSDIDLAAGTVTFCRAIIDGGPTSAWSNEAPRPAASGRSHWPLRQPSGSVPSGVRGAGGGRRDEARSRGLRVRHRARRQRLVATGQRLCRSRRIRKQAHLDGVRVHDLRHYVATQLLGAGVDPRTVAGRLGHANPTVTMSVYGHFLPEKDRAAADFLDDLLDG